MIRRKEYYVNLFESAKAEFPEEFLQAILQPTGRGGTYATRDYYRALRLLACLRDEHLEPETLAALRTEEDAKKLIHPAVWFRHSYDSVNLAARFDLLKEEEQKVIFNDPNWVASEKIDGFRVWLVAYNRPGQRPMVRMYSRNYSEVDCSLCEYWNHVYQTITVPENTIYVVDCECVFDGDVSLLQQYGLVAETQLQAVTSVAQMDPQEALAFQKRYLEDTGQHFFSFALIHPLYFNGKCYTKRLLGEGMDAYDAAVAFGQSLGFNIRPIIRCNGSSEEKQAFLDSILARGGEGVVFWNRNGHYTASENRDKTSWVKLKRSVTSTFQKEGLGDSIDAYITGFKMSTEGTSREGLIGAFECTITLLEPDGRTHPHVISYVPGLSLDLARQATIVGEDGKPTLHPDFYGRVVELDGQDISAKSFRLSHPRLVRFRFDKAKEECVYTRQWLETQVL